MVQNLYFRRYSGKVLLLVVVQMVLCVATPAQSVNNAPLTAEEVVRNLVQMNLHRAESLRSFHGTRVYRADYRGIGGKRSAEMVVSVKYVSPATKKFTIESSTGSKLIIDRVFKKLLEAESEALDGDMQRRSALTEENYQFTLLAYEPYAGGAKYVLAVEPRTKDKFLYRGKIWVDATDFAVVRLEAEPAKNPSFWTKKSEVVQVYTKVNDFWLPLSNRSESNIRLGGHAELSIDYNDYEITGASRVTKLLAFPVAPDTETVNNK
jgi:hypothetical protein